MNIDIDFDSKLVGTYNNNKKLVDVYFYGLNKTTTTTKILKN